MAHRGSYAKGIAKREEILTRALEVVARQGVRGASVKVIADAVGLSQAGLLHYFDSKEELFTEILRKRDELDQIASRPDADDLVGGFLRVVRHNAEVPGLVELFSRLAVDAADPRHPAHDYFLERSAGLRAEMSASIAALSARGDAPAGDPEAIARIVQAATDGLQLQWLLDPSIDMAGTLETLFALLRAAAGDGSGGGTHAAGSGAASS
ncbi:TetR/AcrR family transcriptional regulator [Microbacterium telephonicum]|uniref:TetR family transcriptional regulator n=1 Tax=Microbacterium telephonicum TaxID=1714841 RepID=A0A498C9P4_9MICO|nr:TetR/AcrR family transcriptional regulator [Microbacterium telephonicum]RLK52442.1 TetR family transcriptional regulator [Microbacterium telephonicum]